MNIIYDKELVAVINALKRIKVIVKGQKAYRENYQTDWHVSLSRSAIRMDSEYTIGGLVWGFYILAPLNGGVWRYYIKGNDTSRDKNMLKRSIMGDFKEIEKQGRRNAQP